MSPQFQLFWPLKKLLNWLIFFVVYQSETNEDFQRWVIILLVGLPTLYLYRCGAGLTNLYNQHAVQTVLNGVSSKSLNLGKAIYQSGALRKVRIFTVHAWIILSASRNKAQPRNWKMLPCLSMAPIRCMVKSQENMIYIHHRLSWIWMFWCKHMEQFIPKRVNSSIMDTMYELLLAWM